MTASLLHNISPRRELRFALLAAMETCWVYMALLFLSTLLHAGHPLLPLSLFIAYWVALNAGRFLPRLKARWLVLQLASITIAVVTLLVLVRIEFYPDYSLFDFRWILRFLVGIGSFSTEFLAALGVVYMYVRGLGFGARPLTLWFTGFQFRLGIVAFFVIFGLSALMARFDPGIWIFVYFAVSLFAIALARMEESAAPVPLGPRWVATLLAAVALVLFLGLGAVQILTLDLVSVVVQLIAIPASLIVGAIFFILIVPFSFIADWLVQALQPFMNGVANLGQMLQGLMPQGALDSMQKVQQQSTLMEQLAPILRGLTVVAVLVGVGYLLARGLNRRMLEIEELTYTREAIGADEEDRAAKERQRRKKAAPRKGRAHISAETIRRIYAALVARAGEAGLPRRPAETPYEFMPRLVHAFPEEAERIQTITEAYIAVHYGEAPADSAQVKRVRQAWEQAQKSIKHK